MTLELNIILSWSLPLLLSGILYFGNRNKAFAVWSFLGLHIILQWSLGIKTGVQTLESVGYVIIGMLGIAWILYEAKKK